MKAIDRDKTSKISRYGVSKEIQGGGSYTPKRYLQAL